MVGFCQTKNREVVVLRNLASNEINENDQAQFEDNTLANTNRKATIIHNEEVKNRVIRIVEKILADKTLFDSKKKQIDVLNSLYSLLLLVHFHKRQKFVAGEQSLKRSYPKQNMTTYLEKKPKNDSLSGRIWH
jgi:hypothetical protein